MYLIQKLTTDISFVQNSENEFFDGAQNPYSKFQTI